MLFLNYQNLYRMCDRCGHNRPIAHLSKYDIGITVDGPMKTTREEIVFTYWLCKDCYLHELERVDRQIHGEEEPLEPGYKEVTREFRHES